jgi:glutamyl-tRNA synthetase
MARKYGFAESIKEYKLNPNGYKGYVADIAKIFRVALTGKTQTPDLYQIINVMGEERVRGRLENMLKILN